MARRAPTMNDVAERAGVSRVTASVVLNNINGNTRVSAATRARIHAAAAALHYRPNAIARSLRDRTTNLIGVYNNGGWIDLKYPFFTELISGLYKGCYATGKSLLLHTPPMNVEAETIYRDLVSLPIDGLIVKTAADDPVLPFLYESYLPIVAIVDALPPLPSVVSDDANGATALFAHLWDKGHRRFFFQLSERPHTSVRRRWETFRTLIGVNGGAYESDTVPDGAAVGFSRGLRTAMGCAIGARPTAVVCWNDRDARSVIAEAEAHGIRVPDDLAVAGYDDSSFAFLPDGRRLTTVSAEWERVAQTAVDLLVSAVRGDPLPTETCLPARFVAGDTT